MNRADFMKNLADLLADVPLAEREEAIQYYNDYFDDAGVENEQGVIASLGTPEQLARTIKAGLFDGGNTGEFTEKGFSGYEQRSNNEVLNPNQPDRGNNAGQSGNANDRGGAWQSGRANEGREPNRDNAYGYRQENRGYTGYQNPYGSQRNATDENAKKQMSGGKIALIVILCVLASPFLLGIGGGGLGVIIGLLGGLFGIVVGFGAAAVSLLIAGVCLFVYGIVLLFGAPLGGLCMMGGGMICLAIGLFFLWVIVMICGALVPAVIRGIVNLFQRIFHKGGETA